MPCHVYNPLKDPHVGATYEPRKPHKLQWNPRFFDICNQNTQMPLSRLHIFKFYSSSGGTTVNIRK